jgi:FHA domain-containing protein
MGLPEFLARFGGTDLDHFTAEVEVPHLVFPAQADEAARRSFMTTRNTSGKARETVEDAGAIGLFPLPLEEGRLVSVGRSASNDVVIRSGEISKVHCFLKRSGEGWEVKDADSANGTACNGKPMNSGEWLPLSDADVILIADFLEVHCLAPPALFALLQGLRSDDAPARNVPRRRTRRFMAVVGDEGELCSRLASVVASLGGEFHHSRLWSDIAPLIWGAEDGDVVLCEPVMYGLKTREFCRIVASHKPGVHLILVGRDSSLPETVGQIAPAEVASELRARFG